jgi:hypothetical protein
MRIIGLDHIQIAIPRNAEMQARAFYAGVLKLEELPKPPEVAGRGGVWFQCVLAGTEREKSKKGPLALASEWRAA